MHTALTIILGIFALWMFGGVINGVASIGKPRKPMAPMDAVRTTVVGALLIAVLIWAAFVVATSR